jgi:hypothetical protein
MCSQTTQAPNPPEFCKGAALAETINDGADFLCVTAATTLLLPTPVSVPGAASSWYFLSSSEDETATAQLKSDMLA